MNKEKHKEEEKEKFAEKVEKGEVMAFT